MKVQTSCALCCALPKLIRNRSALFAHYYATLLLGHYGKSGVYAWTLNVLTLMPPTYSTS